MLSDLESIQLINLILAPGHTSKIHVGIQTEGIYKNGLLVGNWKEYLKNMN